MTNAPARIPQASPLANYRLHAAEIDEAIRRVLDSGIYLTGDETRSFEEEFASFIGVAHAIGTSSGTDALWLALAGHEVGAGDEVITVSHTAVATAAAIEFCGATPIFVDIDPRSMTLDPRGLEAARTSRTRAVVVVHLYGQAADLDPIVDFCRWHGLRLIEDCAQATGASYRGRRVGSLGDAGAFSFYPTKNLGALGDGGMVVTNSSRAAGEMRALREYGWRTATRLSERSGRNARIDELQAAILRVKLPRLDAENTRRQQIARIYDNALAAVESLTLPVAWDFAPGVYHQYAIRSLRRAGLAAHLSASGIATAIHYPVPIHMQPAYRKRGLTAKGAALPETTRVAAEVLSLPMFPELETTAVEEVAATVAEFAGP
jgi:dTDP-4-amino-4,6-dideoxygalactose transaminase